MCGPTPMAASPSLPSSPSGRMARLAGHTSAAITPIGRQTTSCSIPFAEETEMARGDRPLPFEQLESYMRGAKFAAFALSRRHGEHDPDLADDAARYVEMAETYRQAAIATFRAKRERSQATGAGNKGYAGLDSIAA